MVLESALLIMYSVYIYIYIKFALTSVIEHSCQQIEMTSGIYIQGWP